MEIIIREPNKYKRRTAWFQNGARNDTVTDVKFLDEHTLVVANREDSKMYLVEFSLNPNSINIISSLDLIYDNQPRLVDLFTLHKNKIWFVSLDDTICTVNIVDRKLVKDKIIYLGNKCQFHGINFDPEDDDILYLSGAMNDRTLTKYRLSDQKIIKREPLSGMERKLLKQCRFIKNDYFFFPIIIKRL